MMLTATLLAMQVASQCHCEGEMCDPKQYDLRTCGSVAVHSLGADSTGFGRASGSLTLTFMHHGAHAWADLMGSQLRNPPKMMEWIPTFVPSGVLAAGSQIVFHCPNTAAVETCDAWVFFYHCPQSCTPKYQGGVMQDLTAAGWEFTKCAPSFVTGVASGYVHQMKSFRMKLSPGQTEKLTIGRDAEFLAFAIDSTAEDCSKHVDQTGCDAAGMSCTWDVDTCKPNVCHRPGRGPPPPCTECPWKDIVSRPPADGPFSP